MFFNCPPSTHTAIHAKICGLDRKRSREDKIQFVNARYTIRHSNKSHVLHDNVLDSTTAPSPCCCQVRLALLVNLQPYRSYYNCQRGFPLPCHKSNHMTQQLLRAPVSSGVFSATPWITHIKLTSCMYCTDYPFPLPIRPGGIDVIQHLSSLRSGPGIKLAP